MISKIKHGIILVYKFGLIVFLNWMNSILHCTKKKILEKWKLKMIKVRKKILNYSGK